MNIYVLSIVLAVLHAVVIVTATSTCYQL